MNPQMFNSFLDGTKNAIEMVVTANSCGLDMSSDGLHFLTCGADNVARVLRPRDLGGQLEKQGIAETISLLERDRRLVFHDFRWGIYVLFEMANDYTSGCSIKYALRTDHADHFTAMYRPFHLIGLELPISVLSVSLRKEPTGQSRETLGTVTSIAKRGFEGGRKA